MTHHNTPPLEPRLGESRRKPFLNTPSGLTLCIFLAVAGVFLWVEHRGHVLGALPLLLPLLICIGMHFFMHRGHGGHGGQSGDRDGR